MDWPLIRFLAVIVCLVTTGLGLGYLIVTHPDWQIASEASQDRLTKGPAVGLKQDRVSLQSTNPVR